MLGISCSGSAVLRVNLLASECDCYTEWERFLYPPPSGNCVNPGLTTGEFLLRAAVSRSCLDGYTVPGEL